MPDRKFDIAQYLVNLNALMDAQNASGNIPSTTLKTEYNRMWDQLKQEIANEAGPINQPSR